MPEEKQNPWPKFVWVFFALSLLISAAVLICLCWYGLTGSGFSSDFPTWLPGVAAGLTLICTIINISSTNPSACEILIPDTIQLALWLAATIKMALYITGNGSFGSCGGVAAGLKSTCAISQLVLWAGVALIHISFAKLATAFYVRRVRCQRSAAAAAQEPDCEKVQITPLQTY